MRWLLVCVLWLGAVHFFYPAPEGTMAELYAESYTELAEIMEDYP